jgi:DNA-binding transcriptional LysR family regulator
VTDDLDVGELRDASLGQLRALVSVDESRSFAEAARRLGTSRAYVWQQVERLERNINAGRPRSAPGSVRLTVEGRAELTAAGQAVVGVARDLVRRADALRGVIHDVRRGIVTTRVACLPAHAPLVVRAVERIGGEDAARAVLSEADDAHRRRSGEALVSLLEHGNADLVIAPSPPTVEAGLTATLLYRWCVVAVMTEDVAQRFGLSTAVSEVELAALLSAAASGARLAASPPDHRTRDLLDDAAGGSLPVVFQSESVDAICELAMMGWGICLVAGDALPLRRSTLNLAAVRADGHLLDGTYSALIRESGESSGRVRLASALREVVLNDSDFQYLRIRAGQEPDSM